MLIRKIKKNELDMALIMIWETFIEFEGPIYGSEGVETFRQTLQDEKFLSLNSFYGAFRDDYTLIGVIATRNFGGHISLFFVKREYQMQGIGKKLFLEAVRRSKTNIMTVNSSPFAIPVYKKMGFYETDSEKEKNGILFTPMMYNINK